MGILIPHFLKGLKKWQAHLTIVSFIWKLVNGMIPLGTHFNPPAPCPICHKKEDTNHLLEHTSELGNSGTKLLSILTAETELTAVTHATILGATWKTQCWI